MLAAANDGKEFLEFCLPDLSVFRGIVIRQKFSLSEIGQSSVGRKTFFVMTAKGIMMLAAAACPPPAAGAATAAGSAPSGGVDGGRGRGSGQTRTGCTQGQSRGDL